MNWSLTCPTLPCSPRMLRHLRVLERKMWRLAQVPGKASVLSEFKHTGSEKARIKWQAQNRKKPASSMTLKNIGPTNQSNDSTSIHLWTVSCLSVNSRKIRVSISYCPTFIKFITHVFAFSEIKENLEYLLSETETMLMSAHSKLLVIFHICQLENKCITVN